MKWESEDLSNHFKGCMENVRFSLINVRVGIEDLKLN